jgi:uncharacterized NAD-dependent epimerase/dehydratase family protein
MMSGFPEGCAIVYCEGAFGTTNGKTAHGLVRRTARYDVVAVVDSRHADADAGALLDGRPNGIPIRDSIVNAVVEAQNSGQAVTHLVVGLAPDGGRLPSAARHDILTAISYGLNIDAGLHDFLSEDPRFTAAAQFSGTDLRDVRKTPPRNEMHFFSGKIEEVTALKVAILGTDSAIGKRTTAWLLVDALSADGAPAELIGTGQTAWMQGARFGIILDSLINDFVSGEIEHAVWRAWRKSDAQVLVIEGQGSLMNPAYPGGFEILAAGRPDCVVLQHAPARREYDGFPGYVLHDLPTQIAAIELLSGKPVVAVTVNHEGLPAAEIADACRRITEETGLPAWDVLADGAAPLAELIRARVAGR